MMTTGEAPLEETAAMAQEIHRRVAARHAFSADDPRAVEISDNIEEFQRFLA